MPVEWGKVAHDDVVRAIQEYDRLGAEAFFSAHGFAPTTTYDLIWDEALRYPPKAILGTPTSSPPASAWPPVTSRAASPAPSRSSATWASPSNPATTTVSWELAGTGNNGRRSLLSGCRQVAATPGGFRHHDRSGRRQATDFAAEWARWHQRHEDRLAAPDGFLAITSINWLDETPPLRGRPRRVVRGRLRASGSKLGAGEELTLDGAVIRGRHSFGRIPERGGVPGRPRRVRGGPAGRQRHPAPAPPGPWLRAEFHGTPAYAPTSAGYPGHYRPFDRRPTSPSARWSRAEHVYAAPGAVEFEVDGQPLTLTAFNGHSPGRLTILFTDATSGVTTYAVNHSLPVGRPGADGSVIVDFNRAVNLPCAYTEFATCPLPPAENRLPIPVEAGEQIPTRPPRRPRRIESANRIR